MGVVALAADNVWAAGDSAQDNRLAPSIEHWDGRQWRVVPVAGVPKTGVFSAIAADSPRDVWAVGENDDMYGTALVAHYDGHAWQVVPSLSHPQIETSLVAVAAVSPQDVWAAGAIGGGSSNTVARKIIEHWDGHTWRFVADAPDPVDSLPTLRAMSARAANDVWAVGFHFAEHWNGRKWQRVSLPAGDGVGGVAAAGPNRVWMAGSTLVTSGSKIVPVMDLVSATPCTP